MNLRRLILVGSFVFCVGLLWAVWAREQRIADLQAALEKARIEQPQLKAAAEAELAARSTPAPDAAVPIELLQLRNQFARLSAEKRELAAVATEHTRLQQELASRPKSPAGPATAWLTNYVRASQAKWVGYNTPEDAVQSAMWAVWNRDVDKLLEAFVPEQAQSLRQEIETAGADKFFKKAQIPPGYAIVGQAQVPRQAPDDPEVVELQVQVLPDMPPAPFSVRKVNGQWKLNEKP